MNEKKIIQIASDTIFFGLKNNLPMKAKSKNKLCGDEISIEVSKNVDEIRFETQSCIFTQASAAILANNIKEINKYGIENILDIIEKKLNGEKINFPFDIKNLNLIVDKKYKTRKECIVLPYNAVLKAING